MGITRTKAEGALPPGPRWPAPLQTFAIFARGWWVGRGRWRRRYGDVFAVRSMADSHKKGVVVFAAAEHFRQVFAASPKTFLAGEGSVLRSVLGEHSLLTTDGDVHARARKLLTPSFAGSALKGYAVMFDELAEADVVQWPVGEVVEAYQHTERLTLDIIMRTVFGVSDTERSATSRDPDENSLRSVLGHVLRPNALENLWVLRPSTERFGIGRGYRRSLDRLHQIMDQEIAQRRADPQADERKDVLSRLVAAEVDGDRLSDDELRGQLVTLVIAGHETTAKALAWCLLDLAHNPAVQTQAQQAADAGDLDYLTAVFKESLRLHPVVTAIRRELTEPWEIGGWRIPKGVVLIPWISAPHVEERWFPNAEAFDPERFTGSHQPQQWAPFGGGVRRCIGAAFAQSEAAHILRSVLIRHTVLPASETMERESRLPNIVVGPRHGGRVRLVRRASTTKTSLDHAEMSAVGKCPVQH